MLYVELAGSLYSCDRVVSFVQKVSPWCSRGSIPRACPGMSNLYQMPSELWPGKSGEDLISFVSLSNDYDRVEVAGMNREHG